MRIYAYSAYQRHNYQDQWVRWLLHSGTHRTSRYRGSISKAFMYRSAETSLNWHTFLLLPSRCRSSPSSQLQTMEPSRVLVTHPQVNAAIVYRNDWPSRIRGVDPGFMRTVTLRGRGNYSKHHIGKNSHATRSSNTRVDLHIVCDDSIAGQVDLEDECPWTKGRESGRASLHWLRVERDCHVHVTALYP